MDYITASQLKSAIQLDGEDYADEEIKLAITAASKAVDDVTRRQFGPPADGAPTVRVYEPLTRLVRIDDVVEVTEVAGRFGLITDTDPRVLTEHVDYQLHPLNAKADGKPFTAIRLRRSIPAQLQVTGRFGWPEIPATVIGATSLLASRLVRRFREAPFGIVAVGIDGQAARIARSDPDICAMLGPRTHHLLR